MAREALLAQVALRAGRSAIPFVVRRRAYTQDAGFGLKVGASVGPASFNVVSLQSAPTLREAFRPGAAVPT